MPEAELTDGVVIVVRAGDPPAMPSASQREQRTAVFVGDPDDPASVAAAAEMQAELFRS